jgi:hypothetical protein
MKRGYQLNESIGTLQEKGEMPELSHTPLWRLSKKAAICKPRRESSPETQPCQHLHLGLPTSRTVRKYNTEG